MCAEGLREKAAQAEADERRLFLARLKPRPSFCGLHAGKGSETGRFTRRLKPCPDERRLLFAFSSRLIVASGW